MTRSGIVAAAFLALGACASEEEAPEPAEILSFTASATSVEIDDTVTISWRTRNALSLELRGNGTALDVSGIDRRSGSIDVRVEETTRFELTATGASRSPATASITATAIAPPSAIVSFTATPDEVEAGEEVVLSWETWKADWVRISRDGERILDAGQPAGILVDTPPRTTTYVIEVLRQDSPGTAKAKVEVIPVIRSFRAVSSGPAPLGAMVDLTWETAGATELTLSNDEGWEILTGLESDTRALPLGAGGIFRLEARSGAHATRAETSVPILLPPTIGSFVAAPALVGADSHGEAVVTLRWADVERAASLELVGDTTGPLALVEVLDAGQLEVPIDQDTTFTLVATNPAGEASATASVRVVPYPSIAHFWARPASVVPYEYFRLDWSATGSRIEVTGNGIPLPGVKDDMLELRYGALTPTSTTYLLRVFNEFGASVEATVDVTVGPMQNLTLSIDPDFVAPGETATITWTNHNGRNLLIRDASDELLWFTHDSEEIASGSYTVPALSEGTHEFHFEMRSGVGDEFLETLTVVASAGPPILEFRADPPEVELGDPVTFSWKVSQDPHGNTPSLHLTAGATDYPLLGAHPLEDSRSFVLPEPGPYLFTLSAQTLLGTKTETVNVLVKAPQALP